MGVLGASWAVLGPSCGPLGPSWGGLGGLLGRLGVSGSRKGGNAQIVPKRPKRLPRGPQDGPRGLQDSPRGAEDRPRRPQEGSDSGPRGELQLTLRGLAPKRTPETAIRLPRRPSRGPTRLPRRLTEKRGLPTPRTRLQNCLQAVAQRLPKKSEQAYMRSLTNKPGTVAGWAESH